MHTTQAGDLVENLASENWLRLFRKPLYRLLHVFGAATVGLQVQDAGVGSTRMDVSPETVRDMDHAQRQIRRLGDAGGGDVHEVFQTPVRFGITEVQRNWEPHPILVDAGRVRPVQVTAEQSDRGAGWGVPVGLGDDD